MASGYSCAEIERKDGCVEIRFHTGGDSLVWGPETGLELANLFGELARDPDIRVVLMTGTGSRFCTTGLALDPMPPFTPADWESVRWHGEHLLMNLLNVQAPVIACINGPVDTHPEIPLLADIVLACDDASVQDAGHILLNVAPTDGLHVFMPLLMGLNRARYFLLTGQCLTAREAQDIGLINEIVPAGDLLHRGRELAAGLLSRNPLVLRYTRLALTHQLKRACLEGLGYGGALEGLAVIDQGLRAKSAAD